MDELNISTELAKVFDSEMDPLDKVSQAFKLITDTILIHSEHEIELRRVMNDQENLVKEQIKSSTIRHMRSIYKTCTLRATGKKAWQDEET